MMLLQSGNFRPVRLSINQSMVASASEADNRTNTGWPMGLACNLYFRILL